MELDSSTVGGAADARSRSGPKSLFDPYDRRGVSRLSDPDFRRREGTRAWLVEWGALLSPWAGVLALVGSCSVLVASKSGSEVVFTGDRLRRVETDYRAADSVIHRRIDSLTAKVDAASAKVDSANTGIARLITITCAQRQSSVAAVVEKCYPDTRRAR